VATAVNLKAGGELIPGTLLLDDATIEDPYPLYRRLVEVAPIWRVGDTNVFTVNSYELLTEAARRVEDFSSHLKYLLYKDEHGLPARHEHAHGNIQILATADPPVHSLHKKLISPAFSPSRLASLEQTIAALTTKLVNESLLVGRTEFMSEVATLVPIEIVSILIGFRNSNADALLKAAFASTDILAGAIPHETLRERTSFSSEVGRWIAQQLESAIHEPREGILGGLATGIRQGEIESWTAIAILHTLLSAGGESTTSLIGNAVRILAGNAELQEQLRQNPTLIPNFVEEVLRLEAPFRHHMRWVPKATMLGDVAIPAGATVLLMWAAANRDPAQFERPDELILDRPRRHVTFGSGIHTCIGNTLARLEARVVLQTVLQLTSVIEPDADRSARQVASLAVRRYEKLPLILRPSVI
jgi:cytochrome P450